MDEIMNIIHYERKGKKLDTLEKFYIYRETKNGNQINDRLTIQSNPIFETIVKHSPQGGQHIQKEVGTPKNDTHKDSTQDSYPSGHTEITTW